MMPPVEIDHKRVRNTPGCPICAMPKDKGLVICWSCNRSLKAKHHGTWGAAAALLIDRCEYMLEKAGVAS